jgi:MerR family transcriptional regulator/heat shock protein HspR
MSERQQRTTRIEVAIDRGVFMISVAAELAEMHPQTLRMYEARGLIEPSRSPKGTRLYSQSDVERLRRIQQMTAELGLNLAGVERVLALEAQLDELNAQLSAMARKAELARAELEQELDERRHRALQRQLDDARARRRRALAVQAAGARSCPRPLARRFRPAADRMVAKGQLGAAIGASSRSEG